MIDQLPIIFREVEDSDISFLFNSWLKSYKGSFNNKNIPTPIYFTGQHKLIEYILPRSNIYIACLEEDPSQIYGYICASKVDGIFCLHYIYVKENFRRLGIARALFNLFVHENNSLSLYTHHTNAMLFLSEKFNLVYNPYILQELQGSLEQVNQRSYNGKK